jgi:hypothetical protein
MEKGVIKYLVPLLLLVIVIALYFDLRSVETIDPQAERYEPAVTDPQPVRQPPQQVVPGGESRLAVGERYASLGELVADQRVAGYLRTGYFGNHWPAMVIEIQTDDDGIRFIRRDGTPHNYKGFEGYRMKGIHLSGPSEEETIVVFRSADKR